MVLLIMVVQVVEVVKKFVTGVTIRMSWTVLVMLHERSIRRKVFVAVIADIMLVRVGDVLTERVAALERTIASIAERHPGNDCVRLASRNFECLRIPKTMKYVR